MNEAGMNIHKQMFFTILALVALLAVFFGIIAWQTGMKGQAPVVAAPALTPQEMILQNPPSNLSADEIAARQSVINQPNPPSHLTAAEIKARQAAVSGSQ